MNTVMLLCQTACTMPDRLALIDGTYRLSYRELLERVVRLTNGLRRIGVGAGKRCGVVSGISHQNVEIYYALSSLGAVFVPLDGGLGEEDLILRMKQTQIDVLFISTAYERKFRKLFRIGWTPEAKILVAIDGTINGFVSYADLVEMPGSAEELGALADGGMNAILFTSGRTGPPRAVAFAHDSFVESVVSGFDRFKQEANKTALVCLPSYHMAGMNAILGAMYAGNTLVLSSWSTPEAWAKVVQCERVNLCVLTPHMLLQLIEAKPGADWDLSSLIGIRYGWDTMPVNTIQCAIEAFPNIRFSQTYGLTEAVGNVVELRSEDCIGSLRVNSPNQRLCSIGRAENGIIQVAGADDETLGPNQVGELVVTPKARIMGWCEENGEFRPFLAPQLRTQDVGYIDEDGYVYLLGFTKDQQRRGSMAEQSTKLTIFPDVYRSHMMPIDHLVYEGAGGSGGPSITNILRFSNQINECTSVEGLREVYFSGVKTIISASLYGLYLLDDEKDYLYIDSDEAENFHLKWIQPKSWNMSVQIQTEAAAEEENLQRKKHLAGHGAYNICLRELIEGLDSPQLICTPLYSDKQKLVGILCFTRSEAEGLFSARDEAMIRVIATNICTALMNIHRSQRLQALNGMLEDAMKMTNYAVLLSNAKGEIQYLNDAACLILDGEQTPSRDKGVLETIRDQLKIISRGDVLVAKDTIHYFRRGNPNSRPLSIRSLASEESSYVVTTMNWVGSSLDFHNIRHMLSERSMELLNLLMMGNSLVQISESMHISKNTINYHLQQLYRKFGVSNKTDLIVKVYAAISGDAPHHEP